MNFTNEKEIEEIIISAFENEFDSLNEKGLDIFQTCERGKGKLFQQVNMNAYGIADLIYIERTDWQMLIIKVIELKNRHIEIKDYEQTCRYIQAIKSIFKHNKPKLHIEVTGVLIGLGINNCHYANNIIENISIYTIEYNLNGIQFRNSRSWHREDAELQINKISYGKAIH